MRYKCIPCDHEFEVKKGTKPRCPRCLQIHDIELISEDEGSGGEGPKRSALIPIIVLAIAAAVSIAFYLVKKDTGGEGGGAEETQAPVKNVKSLLISLGVPKDEAIDPCGVTPKVAEFAKKHAGGETGSDAMKPLYQAILKLKSDGRWIPHNQREPKAERPLTAAMMVDRLEDKKNTGPYKALSYEVACLLFAAATSQEADVQMAEIISFNGEKAPADPEGKLGRYGVTLGKGKDAPLFDPYGGRSGDAAKATVAPLGQTETMAPYFGIGALSLLVRQQMSDALKLNDIAIKLDPISPCFRAGRGFVFAATGVPEESVVEFEKALKQRPDAVQRVNLAELLMAMNPLDKRPETEVLQALKEMPNFARAHLIKAMFHMIRQESEAAETELTLAEKLDPKSPSVAMYWARYYGAKADSEAAIAKAREAVRLSEESVASLIGLAGIYRELARFSEMRETLDKVYAKLDTPEMAAQIKQLFGYEPGSTDETVAEEEKADEPVDLDALDNAKTDFELKLGDGIGKGSPPTLGGGSKLKLDMKMK